VRVHGSGDRVRCLEVNAPEGPGLLLPQWMLDAVACSSMRSVSHPAVCFSALDDLRQLLLEVCALDPTPASRDTAGHEQTTSRSRRSTEPVACTPNHPRVERSAAEVSSRAYRPAGRAPEAAGTKGSRRRRNTGGDDSTAQQRAVLTTTARPADRRSTRWSCWYSCTGLSCRPQQPVPHRSTRQRCRTGGARGGPRSSAQPRARGPRWPW
jgi:hypothetical protein